MPKLVVFSDKLRSSMNNIFCYGARGDLRRILRARLEYLRETFQIKENDFLTFDAVVCSMTGLVYPLVTEVLFMKAFVMNLLSYTGFLMQCICASNGPAASCTVCGTRHPFES